jgi:predicted O-methyltransferase YrrM
MVGLCVQLNVLIDPGARITCVDIFSGAGYETRFDNNIGLTGQGHKVAKLKGQSWELLRGLEPSSFDFVYVDGSHAGRDVLEDAVLSYRLAKTGGIIVFDDYPWPVVHGAVDVFIRFYEGDIEMISMGRQVCVRKTN